MAEGAPEGGHVLVVDDEPAVLDVMAVTLEWAGFEVLRAKDGRAAVAALEAHASDLQVLFLDILCPNAGNSRLVVDAVRRLRPGLPIVLCSGQFEEQAYEVLDLPVGGGDLNCTFLQKPYKTGALEAIARKLAARA